LGLRCGKTEAVVVVPVIWVVPVTISAPEVVRIVVVPRTAANTTVKPAEPSDILYIERFNFKQISE
jgi:hypothetical protein